MYGVICEERSISPHILPCGTCWEKISGVRKTQAPSYDVHRPREDSNHSSCWGLLKALVMLMRMAGPDFMCPEVDIHSIWVTVCHVSLTNTPGTISSQNLSSVQNCILEQDISHIVMKSCAWWLWHSASVTHTNIRRNQNKMIQVIKRHKCDPLNQKEKKFQSAFPLKKKLSCPHHDFKLKLVEI